MTEPREMTADEVKDKWLDLIWQSIDFWERHLYELTPRESLAGLAKNILRMLNAGCLEMPGFILAPNPNEHWKKEAIACGENWFPENLDTEVNCRIEWRRDFEKDFDAHDPKKGDPSGND